MAQAWTPTAENFIGRVTKARTAVADRLLALAYVGPAAVAGYHAAARCVSSKTDGRWRKTGTSLY